VATRDHFPVILVLGVCYNYSGSSYAYFGNLIAVQGLIGIATFADALRYWAANEPKREIGPHSSLTLQRS